MSTDHRRRVVITGLGVVAPNGTGKKTFWNNLIAGESATDYISAFDASGMSCRVAAEVRDFRPSDFIGNGFRRMARFSQFAVASARMALEDAHLALHPSLAATAAVSFGTSVAGIELAISSVEDFTSRGPGAVKPWAALDYPAHAAASYLAAQLGFKGPAVTVSSNCCTGVDVIHSAAQEISSGRAQVAVAGASDAPIFPVVIDGFAKLGALTTRTENVKAASRPYDGLRDGLVLGEGGACLVLEELQFARGRGATIYAEVLGHAAANEALGMGRGDVTGTVLASAIQQAIRTSGLNVADIDHINAHGSSIPDFDVCDTEAFKRALGAHAYRIPVTSIKSMIGQPISAAGVFQAVSACLSIQHQVVPPTINHEVPDPRCDLDYVPNRARTARVRNVLINGHAFGGNVAALVLGRVAS